MHLAMEPLGLDIGLIAEQARQAPALERCRRLKPKKVTQGRGDVYELDRSIGDAAAFQPTGLDDDQRRTCLLNDYATP